MADISKCNDQHCPSKDYCYRFTAPTSDFRQSWGFFNREDDADNCDMFWSNGVDSNKCKLNGVKREGEMCNLKDCAYPKCVQSNYCKYCHQENGIHKMGCETRKITIILLLFIFSMSSCGSRKVNRSNTEIKEETKSEIAILDTSLTTTKSDTNIKIVEDSSIDEISFTPVDNSKPMVINSKTYFNTILKHSKKKSNTNIVKDVKVAKIEQKAIKTSIKDKTSKTTKQSIKVIDKKASYFWLLWLLLLIPIYLAWKKYRDKIWFI